VARSKGRLDDLAKNLGKAHGVAVKAAPMDLGLLGSAQVLWELTESQGLEIEMLINNAGIGLYGEHSVLGPAQVASMLYSIS
jgi:short-subunit dehydrogenase